MACLLLRHRPNGLRSLFLQLVMLRPGGTEVPSAASREREPAEPVLRLYIMCQALRRKCRTRCEAALAGDPLLADPVRLKTGVHC